MRGGLVVAMTTGVRLDLSFGLGVENEYVGILRVVLLRIVSLSQRLLSRWIWWTCVCVCVCVCV